MQELGYYLSHLGPVFGAMFISLVFALGIVLLMFSSWRLVQRH